MAKLRKIRCMNYTVKVPPRIYNLVKSFYSDPPFEAKCGEAESEWRTKYAGIRQECPLYPYSCTLVIVARFADMKVELGTNRYCKTRFLKSDMRMTLGFLGSILNASSDCYKAIERRSMYCGLMLNYNKCINLIANQHITSVICFGWSRCREVNPSPKPATYLGTLPSCTSDDTAEVAIRLGDCIRM